MSSEKKPEIGSVTWRDLTVEDAAKLSEFYSKVVGWRAVEHPMGGYADYEMQDASGTTVAGVCHARGPNANLPPHWLIYITVKDVAASAEACKANGGSIVDGPRGMGGAQMCVIRDPAGAVCVLYQSA
jgi:hypothetical protein